MFIRQKDATCLGQLALEATYSCLALIAVNGELGFLLTGCLMLSMKWAVAFISVPNGQVSTSDLATWLAHSRTGQRTNCFQRIIFPSSMILVLLKCWKEAEMMRLDVEGEYGPWIEPEWSLWALKAAICNPVHFVLSSVCTNKSPWKVSYIYLR